MSTGGRTTGSSALGEHLQRGFDAFMRQWQAWMVPSLIFFALASVTSCVLFLSIGPLSCGMYHLAFRALRNKPVDASGLSRGREVLESSMAAGAVIFLLQLGPVLLLYGSMFFGFSLIVAAERGGSGAAPFLMLVAIGAFMLALLLFMAFSMWVATRTMFVFPLIADRGLDYRSAFRESFAATKEDFWWLLLTHFVANLIGQIGSSVCGIGVIATVPIYFTIMADAYEEKFGIQSVPKDEPIVAEAVPSTAPTPPRRDSGNPYQS